MNNMRNFQKKSKITKNLKASKLLKNCFFRQFPKKKKIIKMMTLLINFTDFPIYLKLPNNNSN